MKQFLKKNKILCTILLIILIGIMVVCIKGFNVELLYKENYRIMINIGKEVNISEIEKITNEVFKETKATVQVATKFNDYVSISTTSITDENKTTLLNKLNEKYNLNLTVEDLKIENIPHTKLSDIVKEYITPFIIITIILSIYVAIRFRKQNTIKAILTFLIYVILTELLVFSIIAIFRIPLGKYIASIIIISYIIGSMFGIKKLEK